MDSTDDLKQYVEGGDGIFVIRNPGNCRAWNGIRYKPGLSAKNVPARKLSMNVATIRPSPRITRIVVPRSRCLRGLRAIQTIVGRSRGEITSPAR